MDWSTYLTKGVTYEKPKYAFLLLKEHPYGRAMLRELLSEGRLNYYQQFITSHCLTLTS